MELRYGLNPHQRAALHLIGTPPVRVLHGSPSYINILDALNAWNLVRDAASSTGAVAAASFKHVSPAGAALAGPIDETMRECWGLAASGDSEVLSAYVRARDCDPKSSYGDFVAVSTEVDLELARFLSGVVSDGIVAPSFVAGTLDLLAAKKRGEFLVLQADPGVLPPAIERREVAGIRLEQESDHGPISSDLLEVVVGSELSPTSITAALLGMVVARYTQSNSVVFVRAGMAIGIGAGQQSRVDCTRLAGGKAAVWWMRRAPRVRTLLAAGALRRQERLNWQSAYAAGDLSDVEWDQLSRLTDAAAPITADERARWLSDLDDVVVVHDGYLPFRDNVDHAARYGAAVLVHPGGSVRSESVELACQQHGITLVRTGRRLFHH